MKVLESIKRHILPLILPTEEEIQKLQIISDKLIRSLRAEAEKLDIFPSFIEKHGSTGIKQTQLAGTSDLDLFIGFDPSDYRNYLQLPAKQRKQALKDLFLEYVKDWYIPAAHQAGFSNYVLSYAEHPYLTVRHNQYEIDIVGCFNLDLEYILVNGPITAVDRTPWHSRIVSERLNSAQKNDVRLLKAFFQANYVYGDKNTLGRFGFTGFSAEMLILFYSDLESVFRNFTNLDKSGIDFFGRPIQKLRKLHRFQDDYLIIIDPVDKARNLASSISERAYKYANYQINHFLKSPAPSFFIKKSLSLPSPKQLSNIEPHLATIELSSDGAVHYTELRDKLYSVAEKLRKILTKESDGTTRFGTSLFELYFEEPTFVIIFFCQHTQLESTYLRKGPPPQKPHNVQQFLEKHPDAFLKDGFYYAPVQRAYLQPFSLITEFFQKAKPIKGLILTSISNKPSSLVAQRAASLMLDYILPLYGILPHD